MKTSHSTHRARTGGVQAAQHDAQASLGLDASEHAGTLKIQNVANYIVRRAITTHPASRITRPAKRQTPNAKRQTPNAKR